MAANIYECFIDGVVRRHDVLKTTVYQELLVKEKVCGFCESWCNREHFPVLQACLFKKK